MSHHQQESRQLCLLAYSIVNVLALWRVSDCLVFALAWCCGPPFSVNPYVNGVNLYPMGTSVKRFWPNGFIDTQYSFHQYPTQRRIRHYVYTPTRRYTYPCTRAIRHTRVSPRPRANAARALPAREGHSLSTTRGGAPLALV